MAECTALRFPPVCLYRMNLFGCTGDHFEWRVSWIAAFSDSMNRVEIHMP